MRLTATAVANAAHAAMLLAGLPVTGTPNSPCRLPFPQNPASPLPPSNLPQVYMCASVVHAPILTAAVAALAPTVAPTLCQPAPVLCVAVAVSVGGDGYGRPLCPATRGAIRGATAFVPATVDDGGGGGPGVHRRGWRSTVCDLRDMRRTLLHRPRALPVLGRRGGHGGMTATPPPLMAAKGTFPAPVCVPPQPAVWQRPDAVRQPRLACPRGHLVVSALCVPGAQAHPTAEPRRLAAARSTTASSPGAAASVAAAETGRQRPVVLSALQAGSDRGLLGASPVEPPNSRSAVV